MSSVVISGDTSGQVTLSVPSVAGTNTVTIPASTGTALIAASGSSITVPTGTGTLALTSDIAGMVLLGTLTTTSGATATLSGLTLTNYKQLYCTFNGVSVAAGATLQIDGQKAAGTLAATDLIVGWITVDLLSGAGLAWLFNGASGSGAVASPYYVKTTYTTASTSITFTASGSTFDAGSILVYGVK